MDEGHEIVPTRWVDVDKAAHKRRKNGPIIPPEDKSRLTGRGDLENFDGIRTDSPTAEIEAHNLIFSFAASAKVRLKVGDISNAFFQGKEMDRVLLLTPERWITRSGIRGRRNNDISKSSDLRHNRCR